VGFLGIILTHRKCSKTPKVIQMNKRPKDTLITPSIALILLLFDLYGAYRKEEKHLKLLDETDAGETITKIATFFRTGQSLTAIFSGNCKNSFFYYLCT
jgi:hypothetical protein